MSIYHNSCLLIGNVGKDPEIIKFDQSGTQVATFSLATSTGGYKTRDGRDIPERTEWHSIHAWGPLAELCARHVHRGDRLTVTGTIRYREYTDNAGNKRTATDIVATDIYLSTRPDATPRPPAPTPADAPAHIAPAQSVPPPTPTAPPPVDAPPPPAGDIPF